MAREEIKGAVCSAFPPGDDSRDPFDCVYDDLRKIAATMVAREGGARTLQATALVHEAFLRFQRSAPQTWDNRGHFFSAAVNSMRRILVEHARHRKTQRCGGGLQVRSLEGIQVAEQAPSEVLLAVDEALERLADVDPLKAEVVKLRFFAGFSIAEVAALLGIAERTVKWHWTFARAWLLDAILEGQNPRPEVT